MGSTKEKKSETLKNLWPEYFSDWDAETEILKICLKIFQNIEHRYNVECKPSITRNQISEIKKVISHIKQHFS